MTTRMRARPCCCCVQRRRALPARRRGTSARRAARTRWARVSAGAHRAGEAGLSGRRGGAAAPSGVRSLALLDGEASAREQLQPHDRRSGAAGRRSVGAVSWHGRRRRGPRTRRQQRRGPAARRDSTRVSVPPWLARPSLTSACADGCTLRTVAAWDPGGADGHSQAWELCHET